MKIRTHWTISSLNSWGTCPRRYQFEYCYEISDWQALGYKIVPAISSPAAERGTRIHKEIEHYLLNESEALPREIGPAWALQVRNLRKRGAIPEQYWAFDSEWYPVDPESDQRWLRLRIDALVLRDDEADVIDFKTGKPYAESVEQIELYSVAAFAARDTLKRVNASLWYLDHAEPLERTYERQDAGKLARKFEGRAARVLSDRAFTPRPGRHCGWCPFRKVCDASEG